MKLTPITYLRALFTGWLGSVSTLLTGGALLTWLLHPVNAFEFIPERLLVAVMVLSFFLANFVFYARSQLPGRSLPETFRRLDEIEGSLPSDSKAQTEVESDPSISRAPQILPPPVQVDPGLSVDGVWWMRDWSHENDTDARRAATFSDNATLSQEGTQVNGEFRNEDGTYEIKGEIRGSRILVGEWREVITDGKPRPIWYGFFMFRIYYHRNEPTMLGRWVGVTSDQEAVKCGIWEWCKPGLKFPTDKIGKKSTWLQKLLF